MRLKAAIFALIVCCNAYSQGSIVFRNTLLFDPRTGEPYDAVATFSNGALVGAGYSASLYLVDGSSESLVGETIFRPSRPGHLSSIQFIISGIRPGEPATFRVKAWETAAGSYETAVQNGFCSGLFPTMSEDDQVTVLLGDPLNPSPVQPATLNGLLPLQLTCVPEPSVFSFAAVGLVLFSSYKNVQRKPQPLVQCG